MTQTIKRTSIIYYKIWSRISKASVLPETPTCSVCKSGLGFLQVRIEPIYHLMTPTAVIWSINLFQLTDMVPVANFRPAPYCRRDGLTQLSYECIPELRLPQKVVSLTFVCFI